jgi:hypothetical protein
MEILNRRSDFDRHVLCRLDRLNCRWKGADEPLVIGVAFQVCGMDGSGPKMLSWIDSRISTM